jgi:hypothetical protein
MVSQPSHTASDEWRRALSVAENIKQTAATLQIEPKHAWLRQVLDEAAEQMRNAVLWAAQQALPDAATHEGVRPLIVAADATRSDAALASYFLSFLKHEHLIADDIAASVGKQLEDVESGMDALSRDLRARTGLDPYFLST